MGNLSLIISLLAVVTALAALAERIRISSPILLVLAGIAIGLIPGLPQIGLHPEVIILVFIPPLVYEAAWNTSWVDFKANFRSILVLAFGLVLFSAMAVAWVVHTFIPGFSWALAFVVGAIVSPTDPVAASSIIRQMGVPRRVIIILDAESLVNDATGLIVYRYAVAAVLTGQFVLLDASGQFFVVVFGGIAIGLTLAFIVRLLHRLTNDTPVVETTLTFLTPFAGYLLAEEWHVSGILAVLSAGIFLTMRSSEFLSRTARLQAINVWNVVTFILNSVIFVLMGLQLRRILMANAEYSAATLLTYGAVVSVAVVLIRFMWVFPAAYLSRWLSPSLRRQEPGFSVKSVTVIAWTGMRGVLSLATALALPLLLPNGRDFPQRDLIIFITYCVIFTTLVVQGLLLPLLIRRLNFRPDTTAQQQETNLRLKIATAAIEHIESHYALDQLPDEMLAVIKHKYEVRIERLRAINGVKRPTIDTTEIRHFHTIQQELVGVERNLVVSMRRDGQYDDEMLRAILFELDVEESRLLLENADPA